MNKKLLALLIASTATTAVVAGEDGQWYINPMVGYQVFDGDRDLDDDALLGLGVEYQYNDRWGTELKYLLGEADSEYPGVGGVDVDHLIVEGMYYLNIKDSNKFAPYLAAGLGHTRYDNSVLGKHESTSFTAGPGVRYHFSEKWSAKADLRWVYDFDGEQQDGLFTLGVSYALGAKQAPATAAAEDTGSADSDGDGVIDSLDQCPNTPAGRRVNEAGCELDSDQDGVVDSQDQCPDTASGAKVDEVGCAVKLSQVKTIELNVTFATGSAELTSGYLQEIDKVAVFMREYASVTAVIEGHTDSQGSAAFNQRLSQQRADAVRNVLVNKLGVDGSRLEAKGFGESRPVASNDTVDGRQANRRVTAVFRAEVTE